MATYITFHDATYNNGFGVIDGSSIVSSSITESGSNQQSAASTKPLATVVATVAIYVAFGSNPNATVATARQYVPAGMPMSFSVGVGNKVAVVAA